MNSVVAAAAGQAILAQKTPTVRNKAGKVVPFVIDGRWGSTTQAVYDNLTVGDKMQVDAVVGAAGSSVAALTADWNRSKWAGNANVSQTSGAQVPAGDVLAALVRELKALGISDQRVIGTLSSPTLLQLETGISVNGMVNPLLVNPVTSASGPFQYILGTWNAYAVKVLGAKVFKDRASYQDATIHAAPGSPGDWKIATKVHAIALKDTYDLLGRNNIPLSVATMYTIHNQGQGRGLDYLKGRIPFSGLTNLAGQSQAAKDLISAARTQVA